MTRVLMTGYYGKGNFGDDVLMQVTYRLLRSMIADAEISIIADGDGAAYVQKMLGEITVLPSGRHGHFDLIVHGGGGIFFDFFAHPARQKVIERLKLALGMRTYLCVENLLRALLGKSRTSATRRLGLGIGVGTYSAGSPKLRENLSTLADFDALWVRDAESVQRLARFASIMKGEVMQGSDLAFLAQYWMPECLPRSANAKPKLGVILRDWNAADEAGYAAALAVLAKDYEITAFVFDRHTDPRMVKLLEPYALQVWEPERMSIAEYSRMLQAQDMLLTSRFHGAICGACLGVPSVILDIEPKLAQAHAMLPQASILVDARDTSQWAAALVRARRISSEAIAADVRMNRDASQAALAHMARWLV